VGAGIIALLGEAGAITGSGVWLSFLLGGVIALFSGYSMGRLGARYPAAGGIVEYLVQGYGVGRFSGAMSIMMYISALVAVSLVARTFGNYAQSLLPAGSPQWFVEVFATAIILLFMVVNLDGARAMARTENLVVLIKMLVLIGFVVIGMFFIQPERLAPANYPPFMTIFYSVAVTFFAYEGFRIVTNTAEDMPDPAHNLPRAIMTAIVLVMLVYIGIALVVFGNLPTEQVVATREFALAEAARPILGQTGFAIVAVTALVATASAINASLYAVTNVTYQLAREGELPEAFGEPIGHSREGLVISSAIIIFLALFFDLSEIAAIGALSMLIIHMVTHIAHLKLLPDTGARRGPVLSAIALNATAVVLGGYHLGRASPGLFLWIAGFFLLAFVLELFFHRLAKRSVLTRTIDNTAGQAIAKGRGTHGQV